MILGLGRDSVKPKWCFSELTRTRLAALAARKPDPAGHSRSRNFQALDMAGITVFSRAAEPKPLDSVSRQALNGSILGTGERNDAPSFHAD